MIDLSKLKTAEQRAKEAFEVAYRQQETSRQISYKEEADPLFFKYQRKSATKDEWLAKVEEIKARYPYPSNISRPSGVTETTSASPFWSGGRLRRYSSSNAGLSNGGVIIFPLTLSA